MNTVVLNHFPCEIDVAALLAKLHIPQDSSYLAEIELLAAAAQLLARPKIVYKEATIEEKGDNFVVVDKIKLTSRVLRANTEEALKVYPFVVTCGTELEAWSNQYTDYFTSFCADAIKEMVLRSAINLFEEQLDTEFGLGHAVNMNPGSLADWPITEQVQVFNLLGNGAELIGVRLTDSCLMLPLKSVAGIRFPKAGTFENCQLCPRENCPSRKVPYSL